MFSKRSKDKVTTDKQVEIIMDEEPRTIEEGIWVPTTVIYDTMPQLITLEPLEESGTWTTDAVKPYIGLFGKGTDYLHHDMANVCRTLAKVQKTHPSTSRQRRGSSRTSPKPYSTGGLGKILPYPP
jgi:hypothetical protein